MFTYSKDGITVSAMLDTRKINAQGNYPVKIRINYKRAREYFPTGKELTKDEWKTLSEQKSRHYKEVREDIQNSFNLVRMNVETIAEKGEFSFHLLKIRMGKSTGDSFNNAIRAKITLLKSEERIGTMRIHEETLRLVTEFAGDNIFFDMLTVQWLKKCEQYWLKTGKNYTSIGIHMRNIRALMNEAKRMGVIKESQYPFGRGNYEIKTGESTKKALSMEQISKIYHYTDGLEATEKYRDLWMFIYLCNGINVIDMIKLRYSDIIDGEICFIRQKTKRTTKVQRKIRAVITPEMESIIKRWGNVNCGNNYIFPYLPEKNTEEEIKKVSGEVCHRINKRMKRIATALGIDNSNMSTYCARHSFATVLKRSGANIAYISESLGHNDLKTTEHYLASFEQDERRKNSILLTNFLTPKD